MNDCYAAKNELRNFSYKTEGLRKLCKRHKAIAKHHEALAKAHQKTAVAHEKLATPLVVSE